MKNLLLLHGAIGAKDQLDALKEKLKENPEEKLKEKLEEISNRQ